LNFTYAFKCYQNNVTGKNVSWPHFSWATLYIRWHIPRTTRSNFTQLSINIARGRGSVLLSGGIAISYVTYLQFCGWVMCARNRTGKRDANRASTQSDSPGDSTNWFVSKLTSVTCRNRLKFSSLVLYYLHIHLLT